MRLIDIGDGSTACPSVVRLPAGAVTVAHKGGSDVDYHTAFHLPRDGTITSSGSQAFTSGGFLKSQGRTTIQLTGGPF